MRYNLYIAAVLSFLTFGSLIVPTIEYQAVTETSLTLIVSICLAVFGLTIVVSDVETQPVSFTCYVYIIFYYLLPGLLQQWIRSYPFYNFKYDEWAEYEAALVCLCFVSIFTVFAIRWRSPLQAAEGRAYFFNPPLSRFLLSSIVMTAISLGCGLLVGYHPFVSRIDLEVFGKQSPVQLILSTISTVGSFLAMLIAIRAVQIYRLKGALPVLLAAVPFLAANSPIALPRYIVGSEILTFAFLFIRPRVKGKMTLLAVLLAAQFTIFPLLSDLSRGGDSYRMTPFTYISTHGDFDGFQSTINVVHYVETSGFKDGRQALSAALFFVPRDWWASKSVGLGGEAAEYEGYPFTSISSPLPSEAFSDFGFLGLLPFAALFGLLSRRLDTRYARARSGGDWASLLVPSFASGYTFILFRGALVAVAGPFTCSLLLAYLAGRMLRPPR